MMRRRKFIAGLAGTVALWPLSSSAQQGDRVQALLSLILRMQAEATAAKISQFIREIESQVGWITELSRSARTMDLNPPGKSRRGYCPRCDVGSYN
jgi:hypothetical protein